MDGCDELVAAIEAASEAELPPLIERLVAAHETLNMEMGRGSIFWRARKCDSPDGFSNASELWYPPKHLAGARRFNDQGEPALYLATRRETALAEIDAKAGDYVHLAGYRYKNDQSARVASVGEWVHLQKRGSMRIGDQKASKALNNILNGFGYERGLPLVYVDAILGDLLAKPDAHTTEYLVTRLIFRAIYTKLPAVDGILYPSVKDFGLNIALRAAVADRAVEGCSSSVLHVRTVRRHGLFEFSTTRAAKGENSDGSYAWLPEVAPNEMVVYGLKPDEIEDGDFPFAGAQRTYE